MPRLAKNIACRYCLGTGIEIDQEKFGWKARSVRQESGLPIKAVAAEMGVSPTYLTYLERGQRRWTANLKERWEAAMTRLKRR